MTEIIDLDALTDVQRTEAADVLVEAFPHDSSAWSGVASAQEEVDAFLHPGRIALAAVEADHVVGWVGAIVHVPTLWELDPIAVRPQAQGRSVGRTLVAALEARARKAGVCTIWLGANDDVGATNLFGKDLYPDVLGALRGLTMARPHPYGFYEKMGYVLVGALPDATGLGKHDILMAKRV